MKHNKLYIFGAFAGVLLCACNEFTPDPEDLEKANKFFETGTFVVDGKEYSKVENVQTTVQGAIFYSIGPISMTANGYKEYLQLNIIQNDLGYTVLTKTLQFLKAFMKYYDPSIEEDVLTLFSEVVQDTYKRFGIDFDKDFYDFAPEDYPTFSDVYETIKAILLSMTDHTHERDIMERLELKIRPLTKDLKYYFDGHTTISHDSDYITFNIKELMNAEENIRNALFFNILKYAWGLCLNKEVDTILMVDEAHVLLGDDNKTKCISECPTNFTLDESNSCLCNFYIDIKR